jgi:nucleoside-diphosphate-sugar epimerase
MSYEKKSVLILGGGGFIGHTIARYLAENRDYVLTIADNFSGRDKDREFVMLCTEYNIKLVSVDLSGKNAFDLLQDHYDYVYMLASVVGVNRCIEEPDEVIRINTNIILNTVEWLRHSMPARVLFTSSSETYAASTDYFKYPIPTDESVPLSIEDTRHPRFTYAVTKILGESAFFAYGQCLGIHTTVVRYHNIYGPGMGFKWAIPHIIQRIYQGENPVKIYGGDQTRAFCFCTDAAEGTVLAMEGSNVEQQIYHIGNNDEISIETLTHTIGKIMGYTGRYENAPTYPGSIARRCPDITKAKTELHYLPKVSLEEGLSRTVAWYQDFFRSGAVITDGFKPPEALAYKQK